MKKNEYNKLEVLEQIDYVKSKLKEGESLRNISSNLGISKTAIRDRFSKIGSIFDAEARQYIKDNFSNN